MPGGVTRHRASSSCTSASEVLHDTFRLMREYTDTLARLIVLENGKARPEPFERRERRERRERLEAGAAP
ncbi:hypothetical protein [Streptomyces sp. NBC_00035]|uniref:hypothetical protein n=1 Tax=Streptomyces sp. NBC_00035 TaxID=2903614 RepID=UPI0032440318